MTPELDPFQRETLDFLDAAGGRAIVADPMGARKTATTLTWLERFAPRWEVPPLRVLVVAPSAVHGHWFREASRFAPSLVHLNGRGTKKQRIAALNHNDTDPFIYVTTYESMKQDEAEIRGAGFGAVVFDEGHKLKGRRTQVALCANAVCKGVPYVIVVTGTPVLNHAYELWQYLHMLEPRKYPAFWTWADHNFRIEIVMFKGNRFPTRIIHGFRPGRETIVRQQLSKLMIQRPIEELFADAAWTVPTEDVVIPVTLTPKERKAYDRLVEHGWAQLDLEKVITDNALALTTRLLQMSSEWGTLDAQMPDGAKVVAGAELIANLVERDEQVVVFVNYQITANRLVDRLRVAGVSAQPFHGGIDLALREQQLVDFQKGDLNVIVGTIDSLGEGVDGLQYASSTIVFVDRKWTHAKNDQAIGRLRRSGQGKRVAVYHIYATDTIDAGVVSACIRKANVVESLAGRPLKDVLYGKHFEIEETA